MRTRANRVADKMLEATVLVAVTTVPLVFNFYSVRVFEGEKTALLRMLALVAAVAWLMRALESGRIRDALKRGLREPLMVAVVIVGFVPWLASLTSIAPRLSLWGSYQRVQGVFTTLAYLTLFFVTTTTFHTSAQRRHRLLRVLLTVSVPVALYAMVQHYNLDPLPWVREEASRVFSTLSNPIFLGAYLILLIPLTLSQLLQGLRSRETAIWRIPAYGILLVLQLLALVFSSSRGPFLGLGAGLFLFALLAALLKGWRRLAWGLMGLGIAGVLFLLGVSLSTGPLTSLQKMPLLGRFAQLGASGSVQVRVLIWESIVERLAQEPGRLVLGFGPEATYVALLPTTRPELRHLESGGRLADRAHNLVFETLMTTGVAGVLAWLLLFAVLFWTTFRALGLAVLPSARLTWMLLTGVGAVLGAVLPRLLQGTWTYSGLGAALGLAAVPLLFTLWVALRPGTAYIGAPDERALLLVALTSALFGHFVERSVGIGVTATLTVFWVLAGLLGAVVRTDSPLTNEDAGSWRSLTAESVIAGLMLTTLAFGLLPLEPVPAPAIGRWIVLGGAWLFFGWLAVNDAGREMLGRGMGLYAVGSLGWFVLFLGLRWLALALGGDAITLLSLFVMWVLSSVFVVASLLPAVREDRQIDEVALPFATPFALMYPVLWGIAFALIVLQILPSLRADIYLRAAQANAEAGRWNVALSLYQQAVNEAPNEEEFHRHLAEAYVTSAPLLDPAQRDIFFDAGRQALERALTLNPENAVERFNLAHLYLLWAQGTSDPGRRQVLLRQATTLYAQAAQAMSRDVRVLDEWGLALLAQGEDDAALTRFREALEIDSHDAQVYFHLGGLYRAQGKTDLALQAYQQAVQLDPEFAEAYRAMADLYREQGELANAIAAQKQAAALQPTNFAVHQNLALLYRDMGDLKQALAEARIALQYAPPERQGALQQFIRELQGEIGD